MARVYVSSTFSDLRDCREQVRLTLKRMDHDDVAMEYYTAEEVRPLDRCLRDVEVSDLYVCLVAWRYGYVPEGHQHSITELEYRRAVEAGKPCLAFLLAEDASWPVPLIEMGAFDKVQAFRQKLQRDHLTSFFTGPGDIGARVAEAVHAWGKRQGVASGGSRTDWEAYRAAVFDKHRWIRLAVIAGAALPSIAAGPTADCAVASSAARAGCPVLPPGASRRPSARRCASWRIAFSSWRIASPCSLVSVCAPAWPAKGQPPSPATAASKRVIPISIPA